MRSLGRTLIDAKTSSRRASKHVILKIERRHSRPGNQQLSAKSPILGAIFPRMHAVIFNVLRTAQRPISRRACRVIAGVRHPQPYRNFHNSPVSFRAPEDPDITEDAKDDAIVGNGEKGKEADEVEDVGAGGSDSIKQPQNLTASVQRMRNGRQSVRRTRSNRLRQPDGLPPLVLPTWFLEKSVKCIGDPDQAGTLAAYESGKGANTTQDDTYELPLSGGGPELPNNAIADTKALDEDMERQASSIVDCKLSPTSKAKYTIHVDVYQEILATLRAGLSLRPPTNSTGQPILRPISLLQCPKDGGTFYLDSVVETIANQLGADLVRLDSQDLAQIVGPYVDGNLAWQKTEASLLGYDAQRAAGKLEEYDKDDSHGEEDVENMGEEEDASGSENPTKHPSFTTSFALSPADVTKRLSSFLRNVDRPFPGKSSRDMEIGSPRMQVFDLRGDSRSPGSSPSTETDQWSALKMAHVLEALVASADSKRASSSQQAESEESELVPRDLIIQVKDYKEMRAVTSGSEMISKLRSAVDAKWQDGRNIILVGTTSTEEGESALSRPEIQHLQADIVDGERRTILVPTDRREEQDNVLESDEKTRIRTMNIRNVEEMISMISQGSSSGTIKVDIEKDLDSAAVYAAGIEDAVWTYPRVHRLATTAFGLNPSTTTIDGATFGNALKILASSDKAKFAWGEAELKSEELEVDNVIEDIAKSADTAKKQQSEKMKHIRKECNSHERKLLGGVVIPSDIKTTFADIRAPSETIEALKTLTSLSLIRPEAFSYGVLATDKIPGLLLYGPPGTGKTLLAKAVAKESGATVLEVSGADVNDMFVGEGEKNVKAVFSLAKKLSPCIVFIDEADAIFAARGEMKQRSSHRELINQFLREWDGMNDMTAFMMIATNRPFDLDEAVLRRLPRRLLVDLPVEKDREAILTIHLKDEVLDESVSLSSIAKDTPFYSGSDLKNVSVAAALACIREENAAASKHEGDEPYVYPTKRTLTKPHFDKALEEISASISEDMSTLTAIRKFDEKYGDRKGRRKKAAALGFGGTNVIEKDSEAARVRNLEI